MGGEGFIPLLRAVPSDEQWNGHEDDNGLPAAADLDL